MPRPGPSPTATAGSGACSAGRGRRGAAARLGPDRSGPRYSLALGLGSPASGHPTRAQRRPAGLPAPDQLLGSRGRTEAASSAAGCGADPGDEMTTSTLQVPRRGAARPGPARPGLRRPKEARRGLRAGGRAASSERRPRALAPSPCRRLRLFLFSRARSRGSPPVQNARLSRPRRAPRPLRVAGAPGLPWGSASPRPHKRHPGSSGPRSGRWLPLLLLLLPFEQTPAPSTVSDFLFSAKDPSFIP
ncbi:hypothetical protein J1605_006699 [Eschrichtius robustus]|uniref:Uncharacterized protein n=1 Tax=Eschrichtius robustus TaxID=9764 RepID=A0AB34H236_ESCRO|nr:hypothetical protein J1605_006699 [Eschrichtius robustus]